MLAKPAPLFFFLLLAAPVLAQAHYIKVPSGTAPNPTTLAATKLAAELGSSWLVDPSPPATPEIEVVDNASLTGETYQLVKTTSSSTLFVNGGNQPAAVNGIHSLRRRLMDGTIAQPPFATMNVQVTPNFARRGVMVAPYGFGGQQGLEAFGCDQWGLEEWKKYVDYLRLLNANFLEVFPLRMWSTDHGTFLDEARYNVWLQVLQYCQAVGMEFHYVMLVNQVSSGFWWSNPSLALTSGYQGTAASLLTAKTMTPDPMELEQADTYTKFKDANAFVFMWNDGGAIDSSTAFTQDPAQGLVDEMTYAHAQLQTAGSNARIIFWGWLHELWMEGIQQGSSENSLSMLSPQSMPFTMEWLTDSDRHYFWQHKEPITMARTYGFDVSNFMYFNNVEDPRECMPYARIEETTAEIKNAKILSATGITGYRLTPGTRQLNDYVTLRLADDISLTPTLVSGTIQNQVRTGLANYLARGHTTNAATISSVLASLDDVVDISYPVPLVEPWSGFGKTVASVPVAGATTLGAYQAVELLTPGNPDLDLWRSLLGFQMMVFLWADSGATPRTPTATGQPTYLEFLHNYVQGKPEFRAFTTQPALIFEADILLEQFMRRIKEPFGW